MQKRPEHLTHCTLQEVADEIGVTRERVRQIEKEALLKVRAGFERLGITDSNFRDDNGSGAEHSIRND